MRICPAHSILAEGDCPACTRDFLGLLGANSLVINRPPLVEDIHDLPDTDGPLCEAMIADGGSANSHVTCVRQARHEGDCEDLHGLLWDHDETCGCYDTPAA